VHLFFSLAPPWLNILRYGERNFFFFLLVHCLLESPLINGAAPYRRVLPRHLLVQMDRGSSLVFVSLTICLPAISTALFLPLTLTVSPLLDRGNCFLPGSPRGSAMLCPFPRRVLQPITFTQSFSKTYRKQFQPTPVPPLPRQRSIFFPS